MDGPQENGGYYCRRKDTDIHRSRLRTPGGMALPTQKSGHFLRPALVALQFAEGPP